ncbi:nucleotide exchange factor GrpE [Amycolatopsis antarctica]|uniref:Protein GrpE n=1 Tax=Amycolatopsis antarctica TaxID=1854586 RepID=A0A263CZ09_9PSEU|nr:nucleotide exchange factor GrpE [Amycolatopsis antarctica]OZM71393.1 nucleotide exchange factor GrpE [Amycolatopsis antarctica]
MTEANRENAAEEPRVVVRDRRRVDPETGEVREQPAVDGVEGVPADADTPGVVPAADEPSVSEVDGVFEEQAGPSKAEQELAERTADLQRLQAEYANYRRRVERDREAVVTGAKASVVGELLPLLDDLERAEQHGDLTGAFKAVGDKLVGGLTRSGLESFGVEGEPFDPSVHEAVQHATSPEVAGPTVTLVMRRGYRFGDRVLRPAMVGVTDHEPGAAPAEAVPPPVEGELPVDPGAADAAANEHRQQ